MFDPNSSHHLAARGLDKTRPPLKSLMTFRIKGWLLKSPCTKGGERPLPESKLTQSPKKVFHVKTGGALNGGMGSLVGQCLGDFSVIMEDPCCNRCGR